MRAWNVMCRSHGAGAQKIIKTTKSKTKMQPPKGRQMAPFKERKYIKVKCV